MCSVNPATEPERESVLEAAEGPRCTWKGGVRIRSQPELIAPRTGDVILYNQTFEVSSELARKVEGVSIIFLQLVDGRGWVVDRDPEDTVCVKVKAIVVPIFKTDEAVEVFNDVVPEWQTGIVHEVKPDGSVLVTYVWHSFKYNLHGHRSGSVHLREDSEVLASCSYANFREQY